MATPQEVQTAITQALTALDQELTLPKPSVDKTELEPFRQELEEMARLLANNQAAASPDRGRWMGRAILDSWPLNSKLGDLIIKAEQLWQQIDQNS